MPQAQRHTILVVDDEVDVVKSVYDLLRLDYKVLRATSAREAMTLMADNEVHVVMSDQRMPDTTGVVLLQSIRELYPRTIRLLFTGYADIKTVIEAINKGHVYRYVNKPWDPDELHTTIRAACDRYDLIGQRDALLLDLRQKNEELAKADELKTAFIRVASHELRTPLTILLSLSGLALRQAEKPEMVKPLLGRIDQAGKRMQKLIDQIITMLGAQRFEQVLEPETVDVAGLIQMAVEDVQPFVELRRQSFVVDVNSQLGQARLDADKIRECLDHLLLNAVKFTPDGGTISLGVRRENNEIIIAIQDTGCGISQTDLEHLFKPFFTSTDVAKHSSGEFEFQKRGIGLGLSVVKAFVELHGGKVDVQTELNKGSTFTIRMPVGTP